MPVSHHFDFFRNTPEKQLISNLFNESIRTFGSDVHYIPRQSEGEIDFLFGDDPLSTFPQAFTMEMYTASFEGWGGDREMLSKFGLEIRDEITFVVTKQIFTKQTGGLTRPKEGDLIYFQPAKALFEIKFVEDEKPFYQLGTRFAFELQCERVRYSHEKINTGIENVDVIEDSYSYAINLNLSGDDSYFIKGETVYQGANLASATATAEAVYFDSTLKVLTINNIKGVFTANTAVKGVQSHNSWTVTSINTNEQVNEDISDNKQLQDEATVLIVPKNNDFTGNTP